MDELAQYLSRKYPQNFICGYQDYNMLLWGMNKDDRVETRCFTLNIGLEYNPRKLNKNDVINILNKKYRDDPLFKQIFIYAKKMARNSDVPFIAIVYPSLRKKYNDNWEASILEYDPDRVEFYCKNIAEDESHVLSGLEMKNYLYRIIECDFEDEGTSKPKNKKLADYFQFWSRAKLSSKITKLDIDGFFVDKLGNGILIEIKRSSKPKIPFWRPYINDKSDYMLQNDFAKRTGAYFWTLHHEGNGECTGDTLISFFSIIGVGTDSKSEKFLICDDEAVPIPLEGINSFNTRINKVLDASAD
ncbi:MAG: hypothetical protein HFI01_04175 [Lachnospiraceae bacterium]|nr:hypothetical protein [Lachnospiraceae bacterium]